MLDMKEKRSILIVEDSDEDYLAMTRILKKLSFEYPVFRCIKGEETLNFLHRREQYATLQTSPRPSVILLDLNLIGMDGKTLLTEIKRDTELRTIPIVALTTSANPKDIEYCYQHCVNSYLLKPVDLDHLTSKVKLLVNYWFEAVQLPAERG